MNTPNDLSRLRAFFDSINWAKLQAEVAGEARTRIVIIGPVNSGKSTLFNLLMGRRLAEVSAVPGTTQTAQTETLGPFKLVDTPGFSEAGGEGRAKLAGAEIEKADMLVLLLDAAAGVRQSDLELYRRVRALSTPMVIALNKTDLVRRDLPAILDDLYFRLQGAPVIPISARTGAGVADRLIPALIRDSEATAVMIGRYLPAFRAKASQRIIVGTALWGLLLGTEPIPGLDLPVLLGMQARMILRLAAIYGESFTAHHAQELAVSLAGSLVARYVGMELAKLIPGPGWVVSGIIAGLSTLAMGKAAEAYFRANHRLSFDQAGELARRLFRLPRSSAASIELPPMPPESPPPADAAPPPPAAQPDAAPDTPER